MTIDPMRASLLRWGVVARRWSAVGLRIPTAATTVENGFYAHQVAMFEKQQRNISER